MHRKTNFDAVPMKPQRVYQCMNRAFDEDTCYISTIGLSQIAGAQFLHVYKPRHWINCGQAGPLGWTVPAALGVRAADPSRKIVALSGDYDFQFMIEELAVGAQFKLPYIHMVVNNSYLGLIRQSQRGFEMDYCVQLGFDNINMPDDGQPERAYGVDHVKVVEGLGCKAIRVHRQEELRPAITQAEAWMKEFQVPVVIEVILERVTNISMGTEIDKINEFEDLATCRRRADAAAMLDCTLPRSACSSQLTETHMPQFAANLTMLFTELPFMERFAAARAAGFDAVEYLFPYAFPKEDLAVALRANGLKQVLHNLPAGHWEAGERGIACHPDRVTEFRDGVALAISYAKALGLPAAQLPGGKAAGGRRA